MKYHPCTHAEAFEHKIIGMQTSWGSTSLTVALRLMLTAALAEPTNHWFVLLSESDVPLYPAVVVYQALMGFTLSRVNACIESWIPPPLVRPSCTQPLLNSVEYCRI